MRNRTSYDAYTVYCRAITTSSVILSYLIRCIECLLSRNTTSSVVLCNSLAFSLDTGKVVIGSKYKPTKNQSKTYQKPIKNLVKTYSKPIKNLSKTYQKHQTY